MSIPNRVQAGVPTGGQFAATALAESDVELTETDLFGEPAAAPTTRPAARGENISGLDLSYGALRDARLEDADATGTIFQSADLRGARMAGIHADGADFSKADLSGADIAGASFVGAQFRDATISGFEDADFRGANLEEAEISSADGADFRDACLANATLSGHFERCDFRGADLRGAQMGHPFSPMGSRTPVTFLDCQFDDDPWDGGANWPSDFDPRENAAFRAHGIDADDQARFRDAGITEPDVAAAWKRAGFAPADAGDWATYTGNPAEAAAFRDHQWDPCDASQWMDAGIPASDAASWRDHDFRGGSGLAPNEDAGAWHREHFNASSADKWASAGYTAPEAAAECARGINWPHEASGPPPRKTAIAAAVAEMTGKAGNKKHTGGAQRVQALRAADMERERQRLVATGDTTLGSPDEVRLAAINQIQASRRRHG